MPEEKQNPPRPHLAVWLTHPSVSCWHLTPAQATHLQRKLPGVAVTVCADETAFLAALPTADIAMVWRFRPAWLVLAPRLRWIATPAAGRDYFQVPPTPGLTISYGSFHGELMAETVLGMMLGAARGLQEAQRRQAAGELWPRAELADVMRPLRSSHLVILGFGAIGQWVGRLAKPFGVRITGVRRSAMAPPAWFTAGDDIIAPDALDAVLPDTDHLVLVLPATPETTNALGERRLRLLPRRAWVYNVGRGSAVDDEALATALCEHRIAGAGLDVFREEPLPATSPLRRAPNVLLLPHASAISPNYLDLFLDEFVGLYAAVPRGTAR